MRPIHITRALSVIAAAALSLSACGLDPKYQATTTTPKPANAASNQVPPHDPSVPLPGAQPLPDVTVTAIRDGSGVRLSDLAPSQKPLLVWFWAPSCATCNLEAEHMQQLSADHSGELTVVGLGAKDSFGDAEKFVARYGMTAPLMVYDEGFAAWKYFGIDGQPATILFDRDGVARERWFGPLHADEVLAKARALA